MELTKQDKKHNFVAIDAIITERLSKCTGRNVKYKAYMTMNKLIEVAEEQYKQIDNAQVHLINARLNNDEEGKKKAISDMETTMCNAMQLLKCFIERKDNIVDLVEVWHETSVEPEYDDKRLVFECKDGFISYCSTKSKAVKCWGTWERVSLGATVRWAYVDDLLPKGGEQWNTTK